jgi:ubiquitin carboxyl-terminal hydrolase 4/11/15
MLKAFRSLFSGADEEDFQQLVKEVSSMTDDQKEKKMQQSRVQLIQEYKLSRKNDKLEWGLAGLDNLGNTCFMASALQCLSNTRALTNFFFTSQWEEQLNTLTSPAKGKLACEYYMLLKKIWQDEKGSTSPSNIKKTILKFTRTFAGYSQQDSQEFISYFLDALHEDLNQVILKPYEPIQDYIPGEPISVFAQKQFESHLKRNQSFIIDTFHGQFYSKIQCPECKYQSLTCDPFDILSMNIPSFESTAVEGYIVNSTYEKIIIEFKLNCNESEELNKVMSHLANCIPDFSDKNYSVYFYLKSRIVENIAYPYKMRVGNAMNNDAILFICKNYDEELCQVVFGDKNTVKADNRLENKHSIQFLIYRGEDMVGIEREMIIPEAASTFDIYLMIYAIHRRAFIEAGLHIEATFSPEFPSSQDELISEFKQFYPTNHFETKKSLFFLLIDNVEQKNLTEDNMLFTKGGSCKLVVRVQINEKLFVGNLKLKKCQKSPVSDIISNKKKICLYDCFESFALDERLDKDNMWYCSKCKEHRQAFKKMALHRLPPVLIIHLKRFKKSVNSYSQYKKNDILVDFPINGLDLSSYTEGSTEKTSYNLFGISNHFGGVGGGHYTAFCKNSLRNKWFKFDDESVSKMDERNLVSTSAYVLFYEKVNSN